MPESIFMLSSSAFVIALTHTLLGPDHYLPFIALARSREWHLSKTLWITFICGLGHVLSSVLLGLVGIAIGSALFKLKHIESVRGDIAAWFLLIFGLAYFLWGLWKVYRHKKHPQPHSHLLSEKSGKSLTFWAIFLIFVFGPCEPLIPLLMYPAADFSTGAVVLIAAIFSVTTIATMLAVVFVVYQGLNRFTFLKAGVYTHSIAGLVVFVSGAAIVFLGL